MPLSEITVYVIGNFGNGLQRLQDKNVKAKLNRIVLSKI